MEKIIKCDKCDNEILVELEWLGTYRGQLKEYITPSGAKRVCLDCAKELNQQIHNNTEKWANQEQEIINNYFVKAEPLEDD